MSGQGKSLRLSVSSRCTRCQTRWRQSKLGLCRTCERELGIEAEGQFERDKERLERQREKQTTVEPSRKFTAAIARTPVQVDVHKGAGGRKGLEYWVVWHGGMDGAAAMGLPLASERGRADIRQWARRLEEP